MSLKVSWKTRKRFSLNSLPSSFHSLDLKRQALSDFPEKKKMTSIVIKLSAGSVRNLDLDIRYDLPDLLKERLWSNGSLVVDKWEAAE